MNSDSSNKSPEQPVNKQSPISSPPVDILPTSVSTEQTPPTPSTPQPLTPIEPPIKNDISKPKSKLILILVIILVLVGLGASGYWVYGKYFVKTQQTEEPATPTFVTNTNSTTDWKLYSNLDVGISFMYPANWSVNGNSNIHVMIPYSEEEIKELKEIAMIVDEAYVGISILILDSEEDLDLYIPKTQNECPVVIEESIYLTGLESRKFIKKYIKCPDLRESGYSEGDTNIQILIKAQKNVSVDYFMEGKHIAEIEKVIESFKPLE